MSDKELTAEPGSLEFYQQLLAIAEGSGHPMDKALVPVLSETIESLEAKASKTAYQHNRKEA